VSKQLLDSHKRLNYMELLNVYLLSYESHSQYFFLLFANLQSTLQIEQ
jgi:hypothetical protein